MQRFTSYDNFFQQYAGESFENLVDWRLFKAQAIAESALKPDAVSPVGAVGLMQLMPGTSREMAGILGVEDTPLDPETNICMGIAYMRRCWDIWKAEKGVERMKFAQGSYNAGPGNIIKAQKIAQLQGLATDQWASIAQALPWVTGKHAAETIGYVARIERIYGRLCNGEII